MTELNCAKNVPSTPAGVSLLDGLGSTTLDFMILPIGNVIMQLTLNACN